MKNETIQIWKPEEYHYPAAGTYIPTLYAKLHDDGAVHPAMIVAPGGGYVMASPNESEYVAAKFFRKGYNTFVLIYSLNITGEHPLGNQASRDLARAVRLIRSRSDAFGIDPSKVYAVGFSAGAHLVGSVSLRFDDEELADTGTCADLSAKPDGAILVYPLINDTFPVLPDDHIMDFLVARDAPAQAQKNCRLDNLVRPDAPPMCIFAGTGDRAVGCRAALDFTEKALNAGARVEFHLFQDAIHGYVGIRSTGEDLMNASYVFRQLYGFVQAADEAAMEKYHWLLQDLKKDMPYGEFCALAAQETIPVIGNLLFGQDFKEMMEADQNGRFDLEIWFKIAEDWIRQTLIK